MSRMNSHERKSPLYMVKRTLPAVVCALLLTGCASPFGQDGYFRDKSGDYTRAEIGEPLSIPESFNSLPMGDALAIPEINADHSDLETVFRVPRPTQRLQHKQGDTYSIERDGDDQWLLAVKSPGEIWPRLQSFLEENDISVLKLNVKQGMLETDWVDLGRDQERGFIYRTVGRWVGVETLGPMEDKFLFTIRQGIQDNSTEIRLQHKGRELTGAGEEPAPEPEQWDNLPQRSLRMDNGILNELMLFLVRDEEDSSVSLVAQDLDIGSLITISADSSDNPVMTIEQLSYARAWAAVDQALIKAKLEVLDKNRTAGLFYILADAEGGLVKDKPDEKPGFFARLFGKKDKNEVADTQVTYLVRVSELTGAVQVTVEENINAFAPKEFSRNLLNLIRDNL